MCSLPYAMTANKTYLSTYFPSLFIKRMSLINKVNFKKCFSENYKRMRLTTRVYSIWLQEFQKLIYSLRVSKPSLNIVLAQVYNFIVIQSH